MVKVGEADREILELWRIGVVQDLHLELIDGVVIQEELVFYTF